MEKEGLGRERRNKAGCGKEDGVGVGGDGEERGVLHHASLSTSTLVSGVEGSVGGFWGLLLLVCDTRPPTPAPKISATPNFSLCLGSLVVRVVCLLSLSPSPSSLIWFSMELNQSDRDSGRHWRQQVARRRERERCEWQAGVSAQNWRPSLALDSNLSAANVLADFIFGVCVYLGSTGVNDVRFAAKVFS